MPHNSTDNLTPSSTPPIYLWKTFLKLRNYHTTQIIGNLLILYQGKKQLFKTTQKYEGVPAHGWGTEGDELSGSFQPKPSRDTIISLDIIDVYNRG